MLLSIFFSQFDVQTLSKILAMLTVFENIQNVKKHHKIFWLSKDDSTGNNEEKNKKRKRWPEDNISSARAGTNRTRQKGIVVKSSVRSQQPFNGIA